MTVHRIDHACTACGLLVHLPGGCQPQPLGDLIPLPCPACSHDAIYSTGIDRYIHLDSRRPNAPCWLSCVRGDTDADVHRANDRYLARRPKRRGTAA
jgi:hypothetical protein